MQKQQLLDEAWLNQVREAPLDPDRPVIDSYHHVWQSKRGYPYLMDDVAQDLVGGHNVLASVFVTSTSEYKTNGPEHLKPVGETEWVHHRAETYARSHPDGPALCAGIVGQVDFRLDPILVDEALEAHKSASSRFRGVRQSATWSDDDAVNVGRPPSERHLLLDPTLRRGFARLARHGLSLDVYVFHDQLGELADLAKALPDLPIVCIHLGGPLGQGRWASDRDAAFQQWKSGVLELASLTNVHMKLCGPAMPWFGFSWEKRALPPTSHDMVEAVGHFQQTAIEAFSPNRCMFESNFPVDKQSCSYISLWNSFKKIAARYSGTEGDDLLCNSAKRFYRLSSVKIPA